MTAHSPGARCVEHWLKREAERGIALLPSTTSAKTGKLRNPYARHAAFFNTTLLPACLSDEAKAMKVIDAFFEQKPEFTAGWYFGRFQTAYRLLVLQVDKRAAFLLRAQQRAAEERVEREERATVQIKGPAAEAVRQIARKWMPPTVARKEQA